MKLHKNYLLLSMVIGLSAYFVVDDYIISPAVNSGFALLGMLLGGAIVVRYLPGLWDVLIKGRRSELQDGAHLAVIGVSFVAFSIVYSGAYSLAWSFFGRDDSWIGSPSSQIGRVLMIIGCLGLYLAPDVNNQQLRVNSVLEVAVIVILAAAVAFALGTYFGQAMMFKLFVP